MQIQQKITPFLSFFSQAEEAANFPAYGFDSNRGYPAPVHKMALRGYGPTTIHCRSWVFMDDFVVWGGLAPAPGRLF